LTIDFRQLDALSAIIRIGSFEAAAQDLGVTVSALSQRIRALEERIGAVLIERGKPCKGTPEGLRVFGHAQMVALHEASMLDEIALVRRERPVDVIIALNADSLSTWFIPALDGIEDLTFSLVVDSLQDNTGHIARGAALAAVTINGRAIAGYDAYDLGAIRYHAVARPAFRDRWFPNGLTAEALSVAPTLAFDEIDRLQHDWASDMAGRDISPPFGIISSSHGLRNAILAGLGWAFLPHPLAEPLLADGQVVDLAPDHPVLSPLVWQVARGAREVLAPVTRAVRRHAATVLVQPETVREPADA